MTNLVICFLRPGIVNKMDLLDYFIFSVSGETPYTVLCYTVENCTCPKEPIHRTGYAISRERKETWYSF